MLISVRMVGISGNNAHVYVKSQSVTIYLYVQQRKEGTPCVPAEFIRNKCVTALALVLGYHLGFVLFHVLGTKSK